MFAVPEESRIAGVRFVDGNNGHFLLRPLITNRVIFVIASDGEGWEHVSVSIREGRKARIPTWAEMCHVKSVFWGPEDVCMQLHPRESKYVNFHDCVLHLWRPNDGRVIPEPEPVLVGPVQKRASVR